MIFEDTIALLHGRYGGKLRDITLDRVVIGVRMVIAGLRELVLKNPRGGSPVTR